MTHISLNSSETDDIEFTAAYGTAVVMTGTRRPTTRSRQPETLEGGSGNVTSRLSTATGVGQDLRGADSFQPDNQGLNPIPSPARQAMPLAAANDARKSRGNRPLLRSDMNRRRKAA